MKKAPKMRAEKRKRARLPAAATPPPPAAPDPTATSPELDGLSPKHRRFVIEYLADQNGKRAAIRAGYSPISAESTASTILSDPKVRAAVDAALEERAQAVGITAAEVMLILARIARGDLRRVVDEQGRVLPLHELPEDVAAAISSVEVDQLFETQEGEGPRGGIRKERVHIGYTTKVKLWDKNKAAELLGKALRMWKELHEHTGKDGGPIEHVEKERPLRKLSLEDMAEIGKVLERANRRDSDPV